MTTKISEYELSQAEQWLASLPKVDRLKPSEDGRTRCDSEAVEWKNKWMLRERAIETIRELIRRERV